MKTDRYLKIVLTIIAINLSFLTLNQLDILPKAYAGEVPPSSGNLNYGLVPLNPDGSIDVRIKSISQDNPLDVNIEKVGGWSLFGGKIKVEIADQPIEVEIDN
jgi:hypothetical protein